MDLGVFYEVIVPLMEVKGTATICISTPLGSWNFYSELTEVRDDRGKRVFNVRHITHGKRPSWKPEEAYSKVKAIFGNRDTLFRREIEGKITDANSPAFRPALLKRAFENDTLDARQEINRPNEPCIYVSIDPNGGASAPEASGSDTAIVSFYISNGRLVICGLDSHPTNDIEEGWQLVNAHLNALRSVEEFASCRFRLIIENLADQAQVLARKVLKHRTDSEIVCSLATPTRYGCYTVPGIKDRYVFRLREIIGQNALWFTSNLVSANPYEAQLTRVELARRTRETFERQAYAFRMIFNVPLSLLANVSIVYSGKGDQEKKRTNRARDDLIMALLFGNYYYSELLADPPKAFCRTRSNVLV